MARWATKLLSALILSTLCFAVFASALPAAQAAEPTATAPVSGGGSSGGSAVDAAAGIALYPILKPISVIAEHVILPITFLLVDLTTGILNFSINYTLKSTNIITGNSGDMISFGWTLVRDLCNMVFIFILIFSSVEVILGSGDAKKVITNVIMAALVVNFSLFLTKLMLDASNLVALTFKTAIDNIVHVALNGSELSGIADFISVRLNTVSLYTKSSFLLSDMTMMLLSAFIRFAMILVVAYTFLQISLIFLARLATIFFLMIFSPLGFVGLLIPQLKGFADDWWKNMKDVLFVMPSFMFMLYIIIRLIGSEQFAVSMAGSGSGVAGLGFSLEQYFAFFLVIFLLNKAVKTAKSMAGEFGEMALKAGNAAAGLALGGATGLSAMALRGTVGRAALSLTKNTAVQNTLRNSAVGRFAFKQLDNAAGATYDVRNAKVAGKVAGGLGLDLDIGKDSGKGGIADRDKKAAEDAAKFYSKIGFADSTVYDKMKDERDEAQEKYRAVKEEHDAVYSAYRDDLKSSNEKTRNEAEEKIKPYRDALQTATENSVVVGKKFKEAEDSFLAAQGQFVDKLSKANITGTVVSEVGEGLSKGLGKVAAVVTNMPANAARILGADSTNYRIENATEAYAKMFETILKGENTVVIKKLREEAKKKSKDKDREKKDKSVSKVIEDAVGEKK